MSKDTENTNYQNEIIHISGMYKNWFLDYASYVILERAVPKYEDGFKPVQHLMSGDDMYLVQSISKLKGAILSGASLSARREAIYINYFKYY